MLYITFFVLKKWFKSSHKIYSWLLPPLVFLLTNRATHFIPSNSRNKAYCSRSWGAFLRSLKQCLTTCCCLFEPIQSILFTLGVSCSLAQLWWASLERSPLGPCGDRLGTGNETDTDRLAAMRECLNTPLSLKKKHSIKNKTTHYWTVLCSCYIVIVVIDRAMKKNLQLYAWKQKSILIKSWPLIPSRSFSLWALHHFQCFHNFYKEDPSITSDYLPLRICSFAATSMPEWPNLHV